MSSLYSFGMTAKRGPPATSIVGVKIRGTEGFWATAVNTENSVIAIIIIRLIAVLFFELIASIGNTSNYKQTRHVFQ